MAPIYLHQEDFSDWVTIHGGLLLDNMLLIFVLLTDKIKLVLQILKYRFIYLGFTNFFSVIYIVTLI
jgi:hypothetical protein